MGYSVPALRDTWDTRDTQIQPDLRIAMEDAAGKCDRDAALMENIAERAAIIEESGAAETREEADRAPRALPGLPSLHRGWHQSLGWHRQLRCRGLAPIPGNSNPPWCAALLPHIRRSLIKISMTRHPEPLEGGVRVIQFEAGTSSGYLQGRLLMSFKAGAQSKDCR